MDVELVASEWEKFMIPQERIESAASRAGGSHAEPHGGEAREIVAPELAVTLEAFLDVKDIVRLDPEELWQFKVAMLRVDRQGSIASWAVIEPRVVTEWRQDVVRRAPWSDVAAAILHALEPYHALLHRAHSTLPLGVLRFPADRVIAVRKRAIMTAWLEEVKDLVVRDFAEHSAWLQYWISINASTGRREHTVTWQRDVERRAEAGSEVAVRVIESIRQRDRAMEGMDRVAVDVDAIVVHVPGVAPEPPPGGSTAS